MLKKIDLTGKVFGRLKVICSASKKEGSAASVWHCQCECGNERDICYQSLADERTRSCGCLQKERTSQASRTHGESGNGGATPEYLTYNRIKGRCYNKSNPKYPIYGNRGVTVCERWLNPDSGYANFLSDMGRRPSPKHSIDRMDPNGNYAPENCHWGTDRDQAINRRSTVWIEFRGDRLPAKYMAAKYGMSRSILRKRLALGWTVETALLTPLTKRGRTCKSPTSRELDYHQNLEVR